MKKFILLSIVFFAVGFSCRQFDKTKNGLLNVEQLASQVFTININSDTTINTSGGAILKIAKGTLAASDNNNEVAIEIKEAYSMEQIIRAGLATQSNGQPLSSGGMIYINSRGGQSVKISKPIAVSIPTPYINNKMQLFKGDTSDRERINWVEPSALPADTQNTWLANGQQLFATRCATCHSIGKDLTGPDLAHILSRTKNKKLMYEFTRNPALTMSYEESGYYRCLKDRFKGVVMTGFPDLTDPVLDNLYSYIENESKVLNLPLPNQYSQACHDSCNTYLKLKDKLTGENDKLSAEKIDMVIQDIVDNAPRSPAKTITTISSPPDPNIKQKVVSRNNQSLYYQFNIQTFGWFNIDMLLEDASTKESSLAVRITGVYKENISIWLAIPDFRVMVQGGLLSGKTDEYGFDNNDATIALPQRAIAYIIALGEYEDKIVLAKKQFTITNTQQFELTPSVISLEEFNMVMKNLSGYEGKNINVNNSRNADTLRKVIKELNDVEKLKPRECDCDCVLKEYQMDAPPETAGSF